MADRLVRLAAAASVAAALVFGVVPAAAEYQLVGFISQQNVYMDTDRLQYFIDPQTNQPYYDVWTKNVYNEAGRQEVIKKVKAMGQYNQDWDNFQYALLHKYYRLDKASFKDIGFVMMTRDDRILELGEIPPDRVTWEAVAPKSLDDNIYKRVKLYEDAYRDMMIDRSVRNRYKVVGNNGRMTASVDTANAKFFRDPYSGNVYAEVWLRVDLDEESVAVKLTERKKKGGSLKGWDYLGYLVDKSYYDFQQNRVLLYGIAYYTKQGALLETIEQPSELRKEWQQPIPGSWGEYIFVRVKAFMTE
ncbi:MAG TPA: hypothetical protein VN521_01620 [Negativicutes bacterium]|nr:hypothetical protein [Negativicutes bacterium]